MGRLSQLLAAAPGRHGNCAGVGSAEPLSIHCATLCPYRLIVAMSSSTPSRLPLSWLFVLGALTAFAPMAIDMYLPALPQIAQQLQASPAHTQLTLAACFLGFAFGQLLYGPVADRFGRKPPLYVGIVIFVAASLGCALAPSIEWLIAMRFLQALGGCSGLVITRAIVRDRFAANEAARFFSLLMLVMGLAPILAPLVGGWLLSVGDWRLIFVVLALFGLANGLATWRYLTETLPVTSRQSLHPRALLRAFAEVLRERQFHGHALVGGFAHAAMFSYITSSSFVFIDYFAVAPEHFGWVFGSNAAGLIALSQLNRYLLRTYSTSQVLRIGNHLALVFGLLLLLAAFQPQPSIWLVALPLFGFVASLGITLPNTSANAMAPFGQRAGTASALLGTLQFFFAALAASVVSSLPGTLLPARGPQAMATVIFVCVALASLASLLLLRKPASH